MKPKTPAKPAPKPTAAELIAAVRGGTSTGVPTPAALAELREIIEYNDTESAPTKRVGQDAAIALLRSHGWQGCSRSALLHLCRTVLSRSSWSKP